ncbi:putative IWS1 transcription factor [Besnoitia besnoiti]|uniref:Putative IWS1 transcription factor n=1 Tax=Besnoitia besnoiti TaxID=94643 RepID=A0A2A9MFL5_BESBE|nr:putative IWS1 transcription factor [Besnoitia besnoiti]PFH35041.1 putative IWS1 transcription factor [Besnoitia besnoiti]
MADLFEDDEGSGIPGEGEENTGPFTEAASAGDEAAGDLERLTDEEDSRDGDDERGEHAEGSHVGGAENDGLFEGGDPRELSKEERRRLKKERKEKKRRKKEKKEKKKKRKRELEGDDGGDGGHDEQGGELSRGRYDSEPHRGELNDEDDETLGGFIERDPEAAIHEAEEERIPVQGGINSDNDRSDIEDYGDHDGARRPVTEFDKTLERMRQRKRRRQPMSDQDCQAYCNTLLQQMSDASSQDEKALEEGKPATAKLQMLDRVCTELVKPKWRSWFLAEGCCQCIATWLAPFKDNTLSNFTLRNRLLHVLTKLPISSQELMNNDLGRVLVLLWHHPDESDENRVIIRQLIQRWTRPMLGLGSSHREFLQERDRAFEANDADLQQKLIAAAKALQAVRPPADDPEENRRRHARIPVNSGHNFIIQPKSDVNSSEQPRPRESGALQTAKSLYRFMEAKTVRKPTKAQKVSIEGRGL